jgi:hypothetical protein
LRLVIERLIGRVAHAIQSIVRVRIKRCEQRVKVLLGGAFDCYEFKGFAQCLV